MDITLQVLIQPSTHALSGLKEAARNRAGNVIDVQFARKWANQQPDGSYQMFCNMGEPRIGYIHVTGVPGGATREQRIARLTTIKNKLTRSIIVQSAVIEGLEQLTRRREWRIKLSTIPDAVRTRFLSDREITVIWEQIKPYVRKRIVVNDLDRLQDDELTVLTDTEISII